MRILTAALLMACASVSLAEQLPSAPGTEVYFIAPRDGEHVKGPVHVVFGLKGMGIAPAGVKFDGTGHHHLLIDTDMPADSTQPLPATENIRHFGKGQTETTLELAPGKHTLQLVFADYTHTPFTPNVISRKITITVKP